MSDIKELLYMHRNEVVLDHVIGIYKNSYNGIIVDIAKVHNGQISSFTPMTKTAAVKILRRLANTISEKNKRELKSNKETYPFPVLHVDNDEKTVAFIVRKNKETSIKYLGKEIKVTNFPDCLFVIFEGLSLNVYEVVNDDLFIPLNLPNINDNGNMCLGGKGYQAEKIKSIPDLMTYFHSIFWNGSFTTHSDSTKNDWSKGVYRYKSRKNPHYYKLKDLV